MSRVPFTHAEADRSSSGVELEIRCGEAAFQVCVDHKRSTGSHRIVRGSRGCTVSRRSAQGHGDWKGTPGPKQYQAGGESRFEC